VYPSVVISSFVAAGIILADILLSSFLKMKPRKK
jgi:hypothetical protein